MLCGTIQPYDASAVIGDTSPTIPDVPLPPRKRCGALRQILSIVVVAIVVTIYATGAAAQAWSAVGSSISGLSTWGARLAVTSGAVTTGAALGGLAFDAAVGSFANQGLGVVLGIQDKISHYSPHIINLTRQSHLNSNQWIITFVCHRL